MPWRCFDLNAPAGVHLRPQLITRGASRWVRSRCSLRRPARAPLMSASSTSLRVRERCVQCVGHGAAHASSQVPLISEGVVNLTPPPTHRSRWGVAREKSSTGSLVGSMCMSHCPRSVMGGKGIAREGLCSALLVRLVGMNRQRQAAFAIRCENAANIRYGHSVNLIPLLGHAEGSVHVQEGQGGQGCTA